MDQQQWIAKSLTIWGVLIAILTALVPALTALFPDYSGMITLEWLAGLDTSVKAAITAIGVVVSSVMILYDRLSGNTAKSLVLRRVNAE